MPNRDHDDTPYNRSEGRFESPRYERDDERSPYQRENSYRSSRDWDRREDVRATNPYRPYAEGYNPARDDNDYRGGSRFEDRSRYGRSYDTRTWDDDARWRERLRSGSDFERGDDFAAGQRGAWGQGRSYGAQGSYGQQGNPQGNFGRDNFGHFGTRGSFSGQSNHGNYGSSSGNDWNRDYTRDWDRDYRGDWNRGSGYDTRNQDEGDFGEQLRHAGRSFVGKVKRAFRGPKGYKRSDDRIREDVNDRLAQQDELDPSEIEVRVENGEVTLTGSVRNRHEKFRAEEIADDVSGVNDVHNQLRIGNVQAQTQTAATTTATTTSPISRNGRA